MTEDRTVGKLNDLLRSELGEPLRAWKRTQDLCFQHPMPAYDSSGQPIYDNICSCGVNVHVHRPECKLSAARRRAIRRNILFDYDDEAARSRMLNRWLIAVKSPFLASQWRILYPAIDFPRDGLWYPVQDQGGYMILDSSQVPDRDATDWVVRVIREFLNTGLNVWDQQYEAYLRKVEDDKASYYGAALDDRVTVSANPSGKSDVSLPTPLWQVKGRRGTLLSNGTVNTGS